MNRFLHQRVRISLSSSSSSSSVFIAAAVAAGLATATFSVVSQYHYGCSPWSSNRGIMPTATLPSTSANTTRISSAGSLSSTDTRTEHNRTPYTATFSVPLSCDSCISSLRTALTPLPGIEKTSFSLHDNLVTTTGTVAPSAIIRAIQSTGRSAILRGSGIREGGAGVCILETPVAESAAQLSQESWDGHLAHQGDDHKNVTCNGKQNGIGVGNGNGTGNGRTESTVRGLIRLIELTDDITMIDLSVSGLREGRWDISVRESGDVSDGLKSIGPVWRRDGNGEGHIGTVDVDKDGRGAMVGEVAWRVWEVVGRGMVVEQHLPRTPPPTSSSPTSQENKNSVITPPVTAVLGVVARSAGVWENDKTVCACSGKTVWEEREEMVGKGIV